MASPNFQLFTSLRYDPLLLSLPANTQESSSPSSPFYMLSLHRDRMLNAATHFNFTPAADALRGPQGVAHLLNTLGENVDVKSAAPMRVKVILTSSGEMTVETNPAPEVREFALYPKRLPPPRSHDAAASMNVSSLTGGALSLGADDEVHGDAPRVEAWDILPDTTSTPPSSYTSYKTTNRDMYDSSRSRVGIQSFAEEKEVLLISESGEVMEGSLTSCYFFRQGRWVTPKGESGGQVGTTRRWALEKGLCVEGVVKLEELVDGEECWISNGVRGFQWGKIKLSK